MTVFKYHKNMACKDCLHYKANEEFIILTLKYTMGNQKTFNESLFLYMISSKNADYYDHSYMTYSVLIWVKGNLSFHKRKKTNKTKKNLFEKERE